MTGLRSTLAGPPPRDGPSVIVGRETGGRFRSGMVVGRGAGATGAEPPPLNGGAGGGATGAETGGRSGCAAGGANGATGAAGGGASKRGEGAAGGAIVTAGAGCDTGGGGTTGAGDTGASGAGGATRETGASASGSSSPAAGASATALPPSPSPSSAVSVFLRAVVRGFLGLVATSTGAAVSTAVPPPPPATELNHARTDSSSPNGTTLMWFGAFSPKPSARSLSRMSLLVTLSSLASWLTRMPLAKTLSVTIRTGRRPAAGP